MCAAAFVLGSCRPAPPVPRADETPEREFILTRFSFEERRDGRRLWQGLAARGTGDVATSDVTDLEITRIPQKSSEMPLHIQAETAHLALAEGHAHFCPLTAFDDAHRRLTGGRADYDEGRQTLHADGPILVTTPRAELHASSATLAIDTGRLVLEGPITGRIEPQATVR